MNSLFLFPGPRKVSWPPGDLGPSYLKGGCVSLGGGFQTSGTGNRGRVLGSVSYLGEELLEGKRNEGRKERAKGRETLIPNARHKPRSI